MGFVKYAGTFRTDKNGKITEWSNDSGHFVSHQDFAAPVAAALGIEDAMFIPWATDHEASLYGTDSIFYQQYNRYTGPYTAKSEGITLELGDNHIFYPHNYHLWYLYHHGQEQHVTFKYGPLLLLMLLSMLWCLVGFCVSRFIKTKKENKLFESDDSEI